MDHNRYKPIELYVSTDKICGPIKGLEQRILKHLENSGNIPDEIINYNVELYLEDPYEGTIYAKLTRKK